MEILPNLLQLSGFASNIYLIVDAEGLTLIDTGLKFDANRIVRSIEKLGRQAGDVRRIILTHSDGDHVGGLARLKALTRARTCASAIEAQAIAKGEPSRELSRGGAGKWLFSLLKGVMRTAPVHIDEILTDGQVLPLLNGLRIVATEGHTPGHISLFAPDVGVLFTGDSIIASGEQLLGSNKAFTWDQTKAVASVRKQAALGARIVCPGHGPVIMDAGGKFPA
jgi:glyoxylase-like metal-dependent hydrolase (beta-lactamase superfamily II)